MKTPVHLLLLFPYTAAILSEPCIEVYLQNFPCRLFLSPVPWGAGEEGKYVEEGAHNGRPFFRRRNTEDMKDNFIYFSGKCWFVSDVLGEKNGKRVKLEGVPTISWYTFRELQHNLMLLYILFLAVMYLYRNFALQHFWCIPFV